MKQNISTQTEFKMKLVIIFLHKIEFLEDILSAFLEIGVSGATVLNSTGMGHIISENIPIFAGLRDTFAGSSPNNKIILVVTPEKVITKISEVLDDVCETNGNSHRYFMISVPIDEIFGLKILE